MISHAGKLACGAAAAFGLAALDPGEAFAGKVTIKLGTLAPEGSLWHNVLARMGQRWRDASGGKVALKIYPGGVAGDEKDMVRKMRIGQLHAGTLTGLGLGEISRATIALQIPMMFESWAELDYVRDRVAPMIEAELAELGFVVLHWGDAGWVQKFSKVPAVSADDFKKLKLFVRAGDPDGEKLWRAAGFQPVPLSPSDMLASLQTGMVEAFGTTPLFALSSQWFGLAKHMLRVDWAPLNGATIVSKKTWDRIPADLQASLRNIAKEEGVSLRDEVRKLDEQAIEAMTERGLKVVVAGAAVKAEWRALAVQTYPVVRGTIVPERYFDEVQRLVAEHRKKKAE